MNTRRFDIIDGPNRDMIFEAMKYVFDDGVVIPIKFDIVSWYSMPPTTDGCTKALLNTKRIKIEEIKHIDETGHMLKLAGCLEAKLSTEFLPYQFESLYNTATRKGSIKIARKSAIIK